MQVRYRIFPQGVSTRINGRHAFIHERVLELIVRETELRGAVTFRKGDLAQRLGCCERSLDRALTRLRRDGYVLSTPKFGETGAQLATSTRPRRTASRSLAVSGRIRTPGTVRESARSA